jgi:cytochrome d ubiquinol oxidase subunit I
MTDFFFARSQMAMSLAFHIIFAALGIGLPVLMAIAEGIYLRTGELVYLELCRRWSKSAAILFAVGAVSGTVLSFELGLLWPNFMARAGAIIGMPFSLEGFAFFTEAIFLGIYLYGWNRVSPRVHWIAGILVAISGILSGIFVVMANAWMNAPTGFTLVNGTIQNIDPIAAMLNPAAFHQSLHMTLAALIATGFLMAAVHAYFLLRDPHNRYHRAALTIALGLAACLTPLQLLSGDISARAVARLQPIKLAAMEAHYHTQSGAPLLVGGWPDSDRRTTQYALHLPYGLSLLTAHDPNARVPGLEEFPREQWPNVRIVHWSFDVMVGAGMLMLAVSLWAAVLKLKRRPWNECPALLRAAIFTGPFGFIAIECGWMVTEVGRQPWIIYGVMRTDEAVTPMRGLIVPFIVFTLLYCFLAVIVVLLLRRQFLASPSNSIGDKESHA